MLPGLSVPYNKIIVFDSDLNFVTYWNMDAPPQNKASFHFVGKSVCTFQHMHEGEIYLPSGFVKKYFSQLLFVLVPARIRSIIIGETDADSKKYCHSSSCLMILLK